MSALSELIKEFEPKPTKKQLELIAKIEDELLVAFIGSTRLEASNFISEYLPCMSRPVYTPRYESYGGGYTNYDEMDIMLATSGFDTLDFY